MAAITIEFPDWVLSALGLSAEELPREVRLAAASHWYQQDRLSVELAAEVAGLPRALLLEEFARRDQLIRR